MNHHQTKTTKMTIAITTTPATSLQPQLHNTCAVDIPVKGPQNKTRDLLAQPFFNYVKDLAMSLNAWGGSINPLDHAIINGGGNSYNMLVAELQALGQNCDSFGGLACQITGQDFLNTLAAFTASLGTTCDVIANVQYGTWEEVVWKIAKLNPKRVIFGMESVTRMDGNTYKNKVAPWIANCRAQFPDKIIVIDAAPAWSTQKKDTDFNNIIKTMDFDEARMYMQVGDWCTFGSNMDDNYTQLLNYFGTTLPNNITSFKNTFPG